MQHWPQITLAIVFFFSYTAMKRKADESSAHTGGKRSHVDRDEDLIGDLDMEAQAARQSKVRRGHVMTLGYDSDDSDNDSGVPQRRAKKNENDDDDDMFADPQPTDEETKSSRKNQRFLKLSDIEGQEFGVQTRVDDDNNDDDDDDDDEYLAHEEDPEYELEQALKSTQHEDANADAERTPPGSPGQGVHHVKKKGMGFRIEGFNMKSEMESGQFDEDGNYIRNKRDQFSQNDRWLEGNYSRKSIKEAQEAQRRREQAEMEREKKEDLEFPTVEHAMKQLAECLLPGETVLDALQRLGAASKRAKEQRENAHDTSVAEFEKLTHVTGVLMSKFGQMNIYDEVYEGLVRVVRRANLVPENWDPSRNHNKFDAALMESTSASQSQVLWQYKWTPAYLAQMAKAQGQKVDPETQVFGPFSQSDLCSWAQQGYFGANKENIAVRRADPNTPTSSWSTWHDAGLP